jgi:hypothetical protein
MSREYRARSFSSLDSRFHQPDDGAHPDTFRVIRLLRSTKLRRDPPKAPLPLIEQGDRDLDGGPDLPLAFLTLGSRPQRRAFRGW